MGLFDKFKKKNKEPEIIIEEQGGKVVFVKKIGSKKFKATKEEAQASIDECKKKYAGKLTEKVNFMGMELDVDTTDALIKVLNDALIENYGTRDEVEELKLKRTIRENEKIAYELSNGTEKDKKRAIKIYEQNMEYGVPCLSYSELAWIYQLNQEYEKAIEICKKGIEVFAKYGKKDPSLETSLKICETTYKFNIFSTNNKKGEQFENQGNIEEAIKCYKENVNLNADTPFTYDRLASIYHNKNEFEKERDVLKLAVERCDIPNVNDKYKSEFKSRLENVETFLNTGKWKYDCLPSDPNNMYYEIKEAKSILKEDKEKGIELLEEIMANGTFSNTVYYTLYQTYKKDKKYDDCIRVCEKAIDKLGYFSNDRLSKWNDYLEKSIKNKEKEEKKKK